MLETLSRFPWEKIAVWFLYVCAQILVFAALLLTTTSMAPHIVFILLTCLLYFITALRNVKRKLFSLATIMESFSPIMKMQNSVLPSLVLNSCSQLQIEI